MLRIDYRNDYTIQLLLDNWWNERYTIPPQAGMEVDRVDTCKEMATKELGYGFLPQIILSGNKEISTLEMKFHTGKPLICKTWMFYSKQSLELKVAKAFHEFISGLDFGIFY